MPITPLGPVSTATMAWKLGRRLRLTVVLKGTFAFVPEARMTLAAAEPVAYDEINDPSGLGLSSAGDLAPRLAQTDVLVTGHAEVPPRYSSPALNVWIGVVRDGAVRIHRSLSLDASKRVGDAHVKIVGAGPISRDWPLRKNLLDKIDPRALVGPVITIPERLDWSYFQCAPAEQRMELLQGDEWLVLGGVFVQRPRLRMQLPEARGLARLYRRSDPAPRAGTPIQLVADTLQVNIDKRCASILWRGDTVVDEAELGQLHVLAGVEIPGRAPLWGDPFPAEAMPPSVASPPPSVASPPPSTPAPRSAPAPQSAPAAPKRPPPPSSAPAKENPLEGTFMVPDEMLVLLAEGPATPFKAAPGGAPPAASERSPRIERTEKEHPKPRPQPGNLLEGTFQLPDDSQLRLASDPATPFQKAGTGEASRPVFNRVQPAAAAPSPRVAPAPQAPAPIPIIENTPPLTAPTPAEPKPAAILNTPIVPGAAAAIRKDNPLEGTFMLPDDALLQGDVEAVPFQIASPAETSAPSEGRPRKKRIVEEVEIERKAPPPSIPMSEANPLEGTFMLPDDVALKLDAAAATPFIPIEPSATPGGLGAAFLEAMAAAGEIS